VKKTFLVNGYIRSAQFLAKPAALRGVWLALQAYVSEREAGGVVYGAASFTGASWAALTGKGGGRRMVDKMIAEELAVWDGANLVLCGYDLEGEQRYRDKIEAGRKGGTVSGDRRRAGRGDRTTPRGEEDETPPDHGWPEAQGNRGEEGSSASTTPSSTPGEESQEGEDREERSPPSGGPTPFEEIARMNLSVVR
jgi:hypothetical protein